MSTGLIIGAFFIGIIAVLFLIMLHELGHFFIAKLCGAYVYELSLGFGPRLYTKKGKETWYSIRLIPLGGFVSIASDSVDPPVNREEEAELIPDSRKLDYIKRWKKALFIIGGPIMNLILALVLITTIFMINGYKTNDMTFYGQRFDQTSLIYKAISKQEEEPFERDSQKFAVTGWEIFLQEKPLNDYNFKKIPTYSELVYKFIDVLDAPEFKDSNNFEKFSFIFTYEKIDLYTGSGSGEIKTERYKADKDTLATWNKAGKISVGITPPTRYFENAGTAFLYGLKETGKQTVAILSALGKIFTGDISGLSGPFGMATQTAQMISAPDTFFLYVAGISANLFMLNMIPIPPLDGYKFLENTIESAIRKDLNKKFKIITYTIGAILFLGLFLVITLKDLFIG